MGKRHKHHTASTSPPRQTHFFIGLRGRYYSQMLHLELLSRKMPEVSRAGSKCSPPSEVKSERRKDRGDRAVQRIELEREAKREGKERGPTTKNVCMMVSCHPLTMVTSVCTTVIPYSHLFDTDSQGVTSDQCSPAQSRAQLIQTQVHLCMS